MHMLYNSDNFAVVQIDVPLTEHPEAPGTTADVPTRGGYEIVDKQARREVFLDGVMAEHFRAGVEDLIRSSPSSDDIDDYLAGFSVLARQPVVLH